VPLGKVCEVIESAGQAMVRLNTTAAVLAIESVAVMVKLKVPGVVGVPVMTPVEVLRANPPGRLPVSAYVYGGVPPAVAICVVYKTPAVPLCKVGGVVIASVEFTRWLAVCVAICWARGQLSVTVITMFVNAPVTDGVPEITQVELLIDSPVGRPVAAQVSGAMPPVVCTVKLNAVPWSAVGRVVLLMIWSGVHRIEIENGCLAVCGDPLESTTLMTKEKMPALLVGVPVIAPVLVLSDKPPGNEPESTENVSGAVPNCVVIVWLYATPIVPLGNALTVICNVGTLDFCIPIWPPMLACPPHFCDCCA